MAKFDPDEADQFLRLTIAGLFMNRDVGSVASACGALLAIANGLGGLVNQDQFRAAQAWAADHEKDPLRLKCLAESN